MSWSPEAKASNVGARDEVIRDRRRDIMAGGKGGLVVDVGSIFSSLVPPSRCIRRPSGARVVIIVCCEGSNIASSMTGKFFNAASFFAVCSARGSSNAGIEGCRSKALRACLSFCNLSWLALDAAEREVHAQNTHFRICSSNSFIFSAFCTFFGFGFLTMTAGAGASSRANQFVSSDLFEKSWSSSSCMTRAGRY